MDCLLFVVEGHICAPLPSVNDILVMHCLAWGSSVALLSSSPCLEEESNTGLSESSKCWILHKRGCLIKARINTSMSSKEISHFVWNGLSNGYLCTFSD